MAGVEHHVVGHQREAAQALDHLARVAARQVGAAAAVEEQGVARDELGVDEEALAAGRVAGRVHELDLDVADPDHVARVVRDEVGLGEARRPHHPRHLVALHVDRAADGARAAGATPAMSKPMIEPPMWSAW